MTQEERVFTYQTRCLLNEKEAACDAYAKIFCGLERKLFAALMAQKDPVALKRLYIRQQGITARQFNSLLYQIKGKIKSAQETQKLHIQDLKANIKDIKKRLPKLKGKELFGKKRRFIILTNKLKKLEHLQKEGKVRLCFGGKKLFRQQFETDDHLAWKQQWEEQRNRSFFSIGSKDETAGNQSCTLTKQGDNLTLRVRLPHSLESLYGKYMLIEDLHFNYGHSEIVAALEENLQRAALYSMKDPSYAHYGRAITIRLLKDIKGWRVFVSLAMKERKKISRKELGSIGVDINVNHLAIAEIDRFGNKVAHKKLPLNLYGKDKNQALALIQEAAKTIVTLAKEQKKPIVMEQLDFQKKKQLLRNECAKRARMLSSFAYNKILEAIKALAYKEGIEVLEVNPAYTSMIGHIKYAARYGVSTHTAAAMCIGRKGLEFLETLPCGEEVTLFTKGGHPLLFEVPVRNPQLDNMAYLQVVSKKYKAAHAERLRAAKESVLNANIKR